MESEKMEAEQQSSSRVSKSKLEEDDDGVPLPGFRFHPTDEELVGFYLKRKVDKKSIKLDLIKHIDVYKHEPWDLPRFSSGVGEREWYFFCRRGRKYKNSVRPNRVTGSGFWKATGIDKPIFSVGKKNQECIGLKKSLVYYRGSAGKGTKTDWMMHEFRLPGAANRTSSATNHPPNIISHEAEVWTLCRIFKREATNKKYGSAEWQKYFSSQKSSKTSSDDHGNNKHQNFEVSAGMIGRIPVMKDPFYESHHQFSGDQMSLSTDDEGPLQASCPSFSSQNGHALLDANWDELRPMVEFALEPEMLYSFR